MAAGTYYVRVEAKESGANAFELRYEVPEVDDYGQDTATAGTVAVEESVAGDVQFVGDRDWFAVNLEADKIYRIDLEGSRTGEGTLDDPYLHGIHDANGILVADTDDDDGGVGSNSRVAFVAPDTATYYVAAGGYDYPWARPSTGTYRLSVEEIFDDFRQDTATKGAVAVGGHVTGDAQFADDQDWFAVALEAGKTYRIDLEGYATGQGTLVDPYLYGIHDANGILVADTDDDDGGVGYNSRLMFVAPDTATYYVAAGGRLGATGTYKLSVEEVEVVVDDFRQDTTTTGAVTVGAPVTGDAQFADDHDWFAVELEAGKAYRIDLEGSPTGEGTLDDPYLYGIHDANGILIADTDDDDGGVGYNSRVIFVAPDTATYYVAAGGHNGYWGAKTGTYKLSVEELADDFRQDTATTGTVAVGESVTGNIEYAGDQDWFAVKLEAGKAYRIDLEGSLTGEGDLDDPYLHGIHDANGILIANTTNDDRGDDDTNSRVTFVAPETATYYVAAGGYDNGWWASTGTYTVSVEEEVTDSL